MSVASYSNHQGLSLSKKPWIHGRTHSGELDVFEAANYFSASDIDDHHSDNTRKPNQECGTMTSNLRSLEPMQTRDHLVQSREIMVKKMIKSKQPSSPGGRLASFLNSLFSHAAASRRKKKSEQDEQRSRMRRSSIGHIDSKSIYSASSAFRSPPPNYNTFDDSESLPDHRRVTPSLPKRVEADNGVSVLDKIMRNPTNVLIKKDMILGDGEDELEFINKVDNMVKGFESMKLVEDDDYYKAESDASSDLFELQLGETSVSNCSISDGIRVG